MNQSDFKAFQDVLTAAADYYGKTLKPTTIRIYWNALERFDLEQVKQLVNRHIQGSRFMPTVAELREAVLCMDGRPGPEESWSQVSRAIGDERATLILTEEQHSAFFIADALGGDKIAARMAFKEAYTRAVDEARAAGKPVKYVAIQGHDPAERESTLIAAREAGKLSVSYVAGLLPQLDVANPDIKKLLTGVVAVSSDDVPHETRVSPEKAREHLARLKSALRAH